jgi:hypothetical protein
MLCPQLKQNLETIKTLKSELDLELFKLKELFKVFKNNIDNKNRNERKKERNLLVKKIKEVGNKIDLNIDGIKDTIIEKEFNLKEQYSSQMEILKNTGLIREFSEGGLGIMGIDGKIFKVPSYEEIMNRVKAKFEILKLKKEQGFTKLIITPFAEPINFLSKSYQEVLLKHYKNKGIFSDYNGSKLGLDLDQPVKFGSIFSADARGRMVYYPQEFDRFHHGGKTKKELLDETGLGFNVIFMQDWSNVDPAKRVGSFAKKEAAVDMDANILLESIQNDSSRKHESFLTLEDCMAYAITALEENGRIINNPDYHSSRIYCAGSYSLDGESVVQYSWNYTENKVELDYDENFSERVISDFVTVVRV